ncbi:hypothetical protein [Ktedonospora formicarum]|uniref:hypothetical protein n=1 Tax=Ktedonospora formicarum TaxID=2778364 RepID=UPI001C68C794|nr:hypothetical protein [Ktedonospora formicarum]
MLRKAFANAACTAAIFAATWFYFRLSVCHATSENLRRLRSGKCMAKGFWSFETLSKANREATACPSPL